MWGYNPLILKAFLKEFKPVLVPVNGINLLISKPDLIDRTILLYMERIPPDQRKTEHELNLSFEEQRPYLLGAMFDALSVAMRTYRT